VLIDAPSPRTRTLSLAAVALVVCFVCVMYVLSSLTYDRTLRSLPGPAGFQNVLAEAFLDGHIDVGAAPEPLLSLPDPYEPTSNAPYRGAGLHDLALYDGKMYVVHGPTPVVLLNLPYRLLGLGDLNPNLATLLFCTGAFLAGVALFEEVRRRYFTSASLWMRLVAIATIGLGTPLPWLISIGRAYEATIACGYLLAALSGYLLMRSLRDPARPNRLLASLGSVAAASAVGARPHLAVLILFVGAAGLVGGRAASTSKDRITFLAALAAPYVLIALALAWYNVARFGSVTEFGTHYQLAGYNMPKYPAYRLSYLWPGVRDYLFAWPRFERSWPYLHLQLLTPYEFTRHTHEPVAGVVWLFPILVVGPTSLLWSIRRLNGRTRAVLKLLALAMCTALLSLIAVSLPFNASTMRYTVDFAPLLVISGICAITYAVVHAEGVIRRRLTCSLWLLASASSVVAGCLLVATRCPGTGSC
jgi:hypothetical protein